MPFYKGNISEYGIEHDSFTCQLEEERVMPQPYQRISHYGIQRTKIADLRIPLHSLLFFTLRVRRQTPFQYTAHTRTEAVLSVKKAPAHHRIASPITFISPETYMFTHFYTYRIRLYKLNKKSRFTIDKNKQKMYPGHTIRVHLVIKE